MAARIIGGSAAGSLAEKGKQKKQLGGDKLLNSI